MKWYLIPWKKYADFSGRARRKEYWIFTLVNSVIIVFPTMLCVEFKVSYNISIVVLIALITFTLATLVPTIAVTVRRLHDTNCSDWFMLVNTSGLMFLDGDIGDNDYGPDPKAGCHYRSNFRTTNSNEKERDLIENQQHYFKNF